MALRAHSLFLRRVAFERAVMAPAAACRGFMICLDNGAPTAARGVLHVLDDVARGVPNMFANEAPAAALGAFVGVSRRLSRHALRITGALRFWIGFATALLRHDVAPAAAQRLPAASG